MGQFTVQDTFNSALQHHQAGRLQEAERLYRKVVAQRPNHADALHMLGVLSAQTGRLDVAVELIRRAIALNLNLPQAHNNLGNALRDLGQLDESIAACKQAIALSPIFPEAYNNLGNALKDKGQLDEAIVAYRHSIGLRPNYAEAHNNLGAALKEKGRVDEAIAASRKAIALRPGYAEAHNNLGNALKEKGQVNEAIAAYRRAVALRPGFPEAHNNLGNALKGKGQLDESIAAHRQAIVLRPDYADAYNSLGNALKEKGELEATIVAYQQAVALRPGWAMPCLNIGQLLREYGRFEEACLAFEQAARCEPENADAHNCLAMALAELQRFKEAWTALDHAAALAPDSVGTHEARGKILLFSGHGAEAVDSFRRAVEIAPDSALGWMNLSRALRQIGRFNEAAESFRELLARRPEAVQAYSLMAGLGETADATEMARLRASANDPQTSMRDRAALGFALGKMLDKADHFDEAFEHYARANSLVLEMRGAVGERYSSELFAKRVDESIATFTPDFFLRVKDWGDASELPVFIVGMPRSGTSLVEQIASSHPDVFGAGELRDIGDLTNSLDLTQGEPGAIKEAAGKQLDRLKALGGAALRVIDKMPANVECLGLIATLFPSARIILCRRDARDTCLSCFFQQFSAGNLFSFDLAQCGRHHVQVDRLMSHWVKVLPMRMLEVQYEELVGDLEGQSRRVIEFLGLPWNAACLDFHRTERTVLTSSDWQVRQPIYTRSVGRWKNYERYLGPLLESLGLCK
ncbi:MAG TPA: tetratricopeptide repeat protein [Tepidisphaeraceae bacterium]|jgi:tetratricopeptide (TPR) repeat protein